MAVKQLSGDERERAQREKNVSKREEKKERGKKKVRERKMG